MKRFRKLMLLLLVMMMAVLAGAGLYLSDYYRADASALEAMASDAFITVTEYENMAVFAPEQPDAGFIFYPGGKVEFTSYAPLMQALARENILCVLLRMPGNLAVLDLDAAAAVPGRFPQIQQWYLGGHSLGGSMAAAWAAQNPEQIQGIALLASYSTADLSQTDLKVLSLYGAEDGVLDFEKMETYGGNLPETALVIPIPGGNHAQFGAYGPQEGDGTPSITAQEQLAVTADALLTWMKQ